MASTVAMPFRLHSLLSRSTSFPRTSIQLQHRFAARSRVSKQICRPSASSSPEQRWQKRNSQSCPVSTRQIRSTTTATASHSSSMNASTDPLPAYSPPTAGILSLLPASWIPYAELIRLDKPTGTLYLFFPCLFSTLLAGPLTCPITPPLTILSTSALFLTGALIMRGAGCTVNDLWDRNLDPKVARTRLRPIARGAISVRQAIPFLGAQLLAGLAVLVQFPTQCLYYGIPSLLLVATYPLAKRVTNYPQFVLGLTFSWGAMMGFPALGIDLLVDTHALIAASCLYASCVAWTIVYDMIYAYQDIKYDSAAGIKSIALAQQANAKTFLASVAASQVGLLTGAGMAVGAGPVFFAGACGGAATALGYMIWKVDLGSVEDCWRWFRQGAWIVGGIISAGLTGEYVVKYVSRLDGESVVHNVGEGM